MFLKINFKWGFDYRKFKNRGNGQAQLDTIQAYNNTNITDPASLVQPNYY